MTLILKWVLNGLAILGIAYYLPGVFVSGFYSALVVALVLGLANAMLKPILIVLTLPVNILTLGLFTLVINAILFWFVGTFIKGFEVSGFWPAFWGALVLTFMNYLMNLLLKRN